MAGEARREAIRQIHRDHRLFYELLGGAILLLIGVAIGAGFFGVGNRDYHMNLATEALGIVATVFIINRWYAHREREQQREQARRDKERQLEQAQREEEQQIEESKRRLIREAGSRSNDIAISAVEELQGKRWLNGDNGLLKGAVLTRANLKDADLRSANLNGCSLIGAILQKAVLTGARLQDAFLSYSDLRGANLAGSKLQRAAFSRANMRGADLSGANLQMANLNGADLLGADLREAIMDGTTFRSESQYAMDFYTDGFVFVPPPTILPDGTEYSHSVDLGIYTDPEHPKYTDTLRAINEIRESLNVAPLEHFDFRPLNETFPYLFSDDATSPT